MIKIRKFIVNPLQENSYLLYDETGECVVLDPGFYYPGEEEDVENFIGENNLHPIKIVNTHCHFDHIMGVEFIRKKYRIPFWCHNAELYWLKHGPSQAVMFNIAMKGVTAPEGFFTGGDVVRFGNSELVILPVPGHSPGHVVFYSEKESFLMAGDVLFSGSIGRSDFPGGNYHDLIYHIRTSLLVLPPDTKVWCGHGPETTIGYEKSHNPFLI